MKDYVILVDTTSELSNEVLKKYNIELIRAHYMNIDGKDHFSFTDWENCDCYESSKDFYKTLRNNPDKFSTAAPSLGEIADKMKEFAKENKDILVFSISSAMSGTFNLYKQAAKLVNEEYEANIKIVDTLRFGGGIGLMAITASKLRNEGKTLEETYNYAEENKNCFHQMGWLDDLYFVARKGRITQSKAFFGQLIGIKPLGETDQNGLTTVLGKAKGEKDAFHAMIEYIKKVGTNLEDQTVLVLHSQRESAALKYAQLLKETFNIKEIFVTESGPSCGINMGPGLMCCYFIGKDISNGCEKEKELMEGILSE